MRLLLLILLVVLHASCKQNSSTAHKPAAQLLDSVYTIIGVINGADSGSVVVLQFLGTPKKPDTAAIAGSQFEFKGKADEALVADIYVPAGSNEPVKALKVIVENSVINIEANKDSLHKATVIGGISNNEFNALKKALVIYEDSLERVGLRAEIANVAGDTIMRDKIYEVYNNIKKEKNITIKQFAIEHPKNVGGAYYITTVYDIVLVN